MVSPQTVFTYPFHNAKLQILLTIDRSFEDEINIKINIGIIKVIDDISLNQKLTRTPCLLQQTLDFYLCFSPEFSVV